MKLNGKDLGQPAGSRTADFANCILGYRLSSSSILAEAAPNTMEIRRRA
tara:strand:- start:240 stop:386 length:147 start_codon:yes stop_codon:yes gene_type:complete